MIERLKAWLELPELAGRELDDPEVTAIRRAVLERKAFLNRLYRECYGLFAHAAERAPDGMRVELGSGAGFLKEVLPGAVTSEVMPLAFVDVAFSAEAMPFSSASVAALFLLDVFHHIPRPRAFLSEAVRCLKPGGRVVMIEPWNTWWSRLVFTHFHHEPFDATAGWDLPGGGPLSTANGALPWIIFMRDRATFEREFPMLRVKRIEPFLPFSYLLSGGVSLRSPAPGWAYPVWRGFEGLLRPLNPQLGMFAHIELELRD